MGVGGNFWDLLKPYAKTEGFNFLRNKRVAVDLSYWIVQHETAIKSNTMNPHIRLTFFRTVNLFSKFGALPVFVVDGTPSPLKSQTRIARFFRGSGIELTSLPVAKEGVSVERNDKFLKSVQECIELLKLLGMPIIKSTGEAEALCAQLNKEGRVDACITSDSDTFLFGADCVIKNLRPNSKEPFECYCMSDIEAGLGLKRKHLIAISLLVGNDYELNGVPGIGIDTALRFVKSFSEDEILNRLREISKGDAIRFPSDIYSVGDFVPSSDGNSQTAKVHHCSVCGHPGSKISHLKLSCEICCPNTTDGCIRKPAGFKCSCSSCDVERKQKEHKKNANWQMNVCEKISMEQNFPNDEIIGIYLGNSQSDFINVGQLCWKDPDSDMLVDLLAYYQSWEPSYIRQKMLPMLSTIFLRKMALNPTNDLLNGQYMFDSVKRVKVKFGHQLFVVSWKKVSPAGNAVYTISSEDGSTCESEEPAEYIHILDDTDEVDVPEIQFDDGCLLTDEDMELVRAAFPEKVDQFLRDKELKEIKSRSKRTCIRCEGTPKNAEATTSRSVQLSIKEFYRSSKVFHQETFSENLAKNAENTHGSSEIKRSGSDKKFSKSVRRRLLFG